eukprot:Filipodium_phascolosomae@DN203_c0_g1_i2.p1
MQMTAAAKCTFKYFKINAKGLAVRFALHHAGIAFEDVRLTGDEFVEIKESLPMKQLPVLEMEAGVFVQAEALGLWAARQSDMHPKETWAAYQAEAFYHVVDEFFVQFPRKGSPATTKALTASFFLEERIPLLAAYVEKGTPIGMTPPR